jgi:hypothetical protein
MERDRDWEGERKVESEGGVAPRRRWPPCQASSSLLDAMPPRYSQSTASSRRIDFCKDHRWLVQTRCAAKETERKRSACPPNADQLFGSLRSLAYGEKKDACIPPWPAYSIQSGTLTMCGTPLSLLLHK